MKKKRRLKKFVYVIPCAIIAFIIIVLISINYYKKITSYSYKLEKIGYSKEQVEIILKLKDEQIDNILNMEYNKVIPKFVKEKYFIYDNLERYLKYYDKNKREKKDKIIALVNVGADSAFYTNTKKTDIDKNYLMLVNKYNYLTKNYEVKDLVDVSILHQYGTQKLNKEAYDKFIEMFNDAKKENITIIINSSYRTFNYQDDLWNSYAKNHGEEWADSYAARAGYSEHQTGLTIDVTTYGVKEQGDFEKTDAYKWMIDNCYKYGFILRYPKNKEDITGYAYEAWHYRYIGVKDATKMHNLDITFDEYYAYYLNKKS